MTKKVNQPNVISAFWEITLRGEKLTKEQRECVAEINIKEDVTASDTCTITLEDPKYIYIEDKLFIKDTPITVTFGLNEDTFRRTFSGYISAVDIDFPDKGYPVLSIFCLDESHVMNRKKKKRTWKGVTNASVVQQIASEYGFKCVVEEGYNFKTEKTISQSNATDIEFCENLAGKERVPFMCKLIDGTLYYVKLGLLADPSALLCYKQYPFDIMSFTPRINKETRQSDVSKSDINTSDKSVDSANADKDNTSRDVQGNEADPELSWNNTTENWEE